MPRERPGVRYFGCEFPTDHVELLESLAAAEDRSTGSLLRIIVASWIEKNSRGAGVPTTPTSDTASGESGEKGQATDERAQPLQNKLRRSLVRNLVAVRKALAAAQIDPVEEASLTPAPALETAKRGRGQKP